MANERHTPRGSQDYRRHEGNNRPKGSFDKQRSRNDRPKNDGKPRRFDDKPRKAYNPDGTVSEVASERKPQGYAGGAGKRRAHNAPSKVTPARIVAHKMCEAVRLEGISVHEASRRFLSEKSRINAEDRAFALLLATGVISTYGCLNRILNEILKDPKDITASVRTALCLSTYEICYLDKQPHAAVDQGVELIREVAPRAYKLANFVLRRVVERKETFPKLGTGDPALDALAAGFPTWMVTELDKARGQAWTNEFLLHSGEKGSVEHVAPIWFTFNTNRIDAAAALEALTKRGVIAAPEKRLTPTQLPVFRLKERSLVADELFAGLLKEGAIVVSDLSAQAITAISMPADRPGSYLEIGAGRGTKSLMLQSLAKERFGNPVNLTAIEINPHKARILGDRAKRAKIPLEVLCMDATDLSGLERTFDAVFVDAPCTGVGTMRRHPEIKWRITPKDVIEIHELNFRMLRAAATKVACGGQLTYATCSVFTQENEDVVKRFLDTEEGKDFVLEPIGAQGKTYFLTKPIPGGPDIHFAARLRRNA